MTTGVGDLYKEGASAAELAWNEPPERYTADPKRIELLVKGKKLIETADDRTIYALLSNVDEFSRIPPEKKKRKRIRGISENEVRTNRATAIAIRHSFNGTLMSVSATCASPDTSVASRWLQPLA